MPLNVDDRLEIEGVCYIVPPARPGVDYPFEAEGGKATVTRLHRENDGSEWAIKEFKHKYRQPEQSATVERLKEIADLPGLKAAQQIVVSAEAAAAMNKPSLSWAVLMPWMAGDPWGDVLSLVAQGKRTYTPEQALHIAKEKLDVLVSLERENLVHCDLSAGNAILQNGKGSNGSMHTVDSGGSVHWQGGQEPGHYHLHLIDLEDMVIRGKKPMTFTPGSPGYSLPGVARTDCLEGDRYAGAILIAEALVLGMPYAKNLTSGEGVFRGNRNDAKARERLHYIFPQLQRQHPDFADLLLRAWNAETLGDCAPLSELRDSLKTNGGAAGEPEEEKTGRFARSKKVIENVTGTPSPSKTNPDTLYSVAAGDASAYQRVNDMTAPPPPENEVRFPTGTVPPPLPLDLEPPLPPARLVPPVSLYGASEIGFAALFCPLLGSILMALNYRRMEDTQKAWWIFLGGLVATKGWLMALALPSVSKSPAMIMLVALASGCIGWGAAHSLQGKALSQYKTAGASNP